MAPAFVHFPSNRGTETVGSAMWIISSSTAWKSPPSLLLNEPGTFSQTRNRGLTMSPALPFLLSRSLISFTILTCSMKSPLLSPASPARFPAMERSWHGLPPVIQSTGSISAPFILQISPKCFTHSPPSSAPPAPGHSWAAALPLPYRPALPGYPQAGLAFCARSPALPGSCA